MALTFCFCIVLGHSPAPRFQFSPDCQTLSRLVKAMTKVSDTGNAVSAEVAPLSSPTQFQGFSSRIVACAFLTELHPVWILPEWLDISCPYFWR